MRRSGRRHRLLALAPLLVATAPFDPFGAATIIEQPGAAVPMDRVFHDAVGHAATLRTVAGGRPLLLAPVLHDCPNLCGITLDGLLAAQGDADVAIVAFGIDPREGPAEAAAALRRLAVRRPAARVAALTGDAAAIRAVTDPIGYRYAWDARIGQYAHVAATAVLTPDGRLVRWLYGIAPTHAVLAAAVTDARAGRTGGVVDRLILLCYHYDPAEGRYGLAIHRILAAGCIATVLLLGGWVWRQRRREARGC